MNAKGKSYWKDHSAAWKASGLTQEAYCQQNGISYQSFVYQHNRINKQSVPVSGLHFIEAKADVGITSSQNTALQVLLPNGVRIGIAGALNDALLQSVLTIAGGITC